MIVDERKRLARQLHDGIAQDLVGVGYSLDLLLGLPDGTPESRAQIRTLRLTVTTLIDKVRQEIYYLRQPSSDSLGETISQLAKNICYEFDLKFTFDEVNIDSTSDQFYEVIQIVQEHLRNIAVHSHANHVEVMLQNLSQDIEIKISDDGFGKLETKPERYGIHSMLERADSIGSFLEITSDDLGTRLLLRIPKNMDVDG